MNPLSSAVMIKALDSLMLRESVTAENIANAGTPGYQPRRVTFEAALANAATQGSSAVEALSPKIGPELADATGSSGVRLDQELVTASASAGRYGALIEILDRQLQISALPYAGGR